MTKSMEDPFGPSQLSDGDPGMPVTDVGDSPSWFDTRPGSVDSTQEGQLHQAIHTTVGALDHEVEGGTQDAYRGHRQMGADIISFEANAEQWLAQARHSIREHPVGAVTAGVAMGMLLARLLR